MSSRVVVGMSGGVDSSVAAALLVERGVDVVGVTMRVWPWKESDEPTRRFGSCCGSEAVDDARRVARELGIPYYVLNMEAEFDRAVIGPFADEYRHGRTPVPCVACNVDLKFGSLLARARAWDAAGVATGHYARVTRDEASGRWLLWRGRDARKDQSDFLWPLRQSQLAAAHFPVGDLDKDHVRAHARRLGLVTADKPESQEICFVPDDDYRGFLRRRDPDLFQPGPIVDGDGRVLGTPASVAGSVSGRGARATSSTSTRPPIASPWGLPRTSSATGSPPRASTSSPAIRRGSRCACRPGFATATGRRRPPSSPRARARPRSSSTRPSARSRRASRSCGTVTTSSSAGA